MCMSELSFEKKLYAFRPWMPISDEKKLKCMFYLLCFNYLGNN